MARVQRRVVEAVRGSQNVGRRDDGAAARHGAAVPVNLHVRIEGEGPRGRGNAAHDAFLRERLGRLEVCSRAG